MKRLIIMGSPRSNGRSAHLAEMLFEANIDERPEDELYLVPISEIEVGPCIGCNACRKQSEVIVRADDGSEVSELKNRCIFDDDMQTLYDLFDEVDQVTVVSPVYFSGAPGMMKSLLDRLQPYFWANARAAEKRPAELHVIGEGGDPHGFGPLVSEVKSALAVAGFRLQRVYDWVGKISAEGEILAEADQQEVVWPAKKGASAGGAAHGGEAAATKGAGERQPSGPRPKLNLAGQKAGAKGSSKSRSGNRAGNQAGNQAGRKPPSKGGAAKDGAQGRGQRGAGKQSGRGGKGGRRG